MALAKKGFKILPLEHIFGNIHDNPYEMWTDADCLLVSSKMEDRLKHLAERTFTP